MISKHYELCQMFTDLMGYTRQELNMPEKVRNLLADLIMEETKELVEALKANDIVEIVDGVCDVRFVATHILCIMGVPDEPFQMEVDLNNIMKFASGYKFREDGKLLKPANHPKPNLRKLLQAIFPEDMPPEDTTTC